MQQPFQQCLARLLASQGLTITHAFPVQLFNTNCPPEHALPTFGRPHTTLGIIIGNTNELWAHFIQHLSSQSAAAGLDNSYGDNPLDAYVEAVVTRAVEQSCHQQEVLPPLPALPQQQEQPQPQQNQPQQQHLQQQLPQQQSHNSTQTHTKFALRFSHHTEPGRFVNMMRAAQLSGLAYYSSTTHLCMHPLYGPWFALRAVAVVDADGPDPSGFTQLPCPYPDVEAEAAVKMKELEALGGFRNWQQHWRDWAALRALGGKHTDPRFAYSADQLEYHYTKNKDVLRRAVAAFREQQQQQQQQMQAGAHQAA